MKVIIPEIFKRYSNIRCGVSAKIDSETTAPYYFNLSFSAGDNPEQVKSNRKKFFEYFGLDYDNAAFQEQIHSNGISIVSEGGNCGKSDAMITARKNTGLAVSTADCIPLFIYDPVREVIAAVHSGWRSSQLKIAAGTIKKMTEHYGTDPSDLSAYMGPSICAECYEVGEEFSELFASKYLTPNGRKFKLNLPLFNYDLLIESGLSSENIEISPYCTYMEKELLHSYRRDGLKSGRAMGLIVMKDSDEK